MNFDLSKTQKMLQQSARTFFQREYPLSKVRELMETEDASDPSHWEGMAEQGWTGLTLPEAYDGLALGLVDLVVVAEEMGRACLPSPFLASTWAATLIANTPNEALKEKYLPSLSLGESIATVALLEEDPDWDTKTVQLKAETSDAGLVLNGSKHQVLDAAAANLYLIIARMDGNLVVAAVSSDAEGLTISPTPAIDPTRRYYRIDLKNVKVDSRQILAEGTAAERAVEASLQTGALLACADMIGGMQWVLETTVEYAQVRQQFDKPIGSFQAVQHQCADMLLLTESARSATYYAAWALHENDPAGARGLNTAKAYCSEAARRVGNSGIQIHGGIGFTWEHDLHLYYKRAKASEFLFGDPTFHRERLARSLLDG